MTHKACCVFEQNYNATHAYKCALRIVWVTYDPYCIMVFYVLSAQIAILCFEKNPRRYGGGKKYTEKKIEKRMKLNVLQMFHFNLV
jgi:hypothetical protein